MSGLTVMDLEAARRQKMMEQVAERERIRTPRTQDLWHRAKQVVPDGFSRARFFWPSPLYIDHGDAGHIVDVDGNRYVDCLMGFGVLLLGHAHPAILDAVDAQLRKGTQYGAAALGEAELAELICSHVPGVERVLMLNSGTEATHAAVRLAVAATGRERIAKFEGGWHGWGDWLAHNGMAYGGEVRHPVTVADSQGIPRVITSNLVTLPFNHDVAVELIREAADDLACVIMEGVQMGAGGIVADADWARAVRQVCRERGVVFVMDEVVTGFRLGSSGASGMLGIEADLVTLSKTIGGGFASGAVGGRADLLEMALPNERGERVLVAGSLSGNPVSAAAGLAQLRFLIGDPSHYAHMNALGARMRAGLRAALGDIGVAGHVVGAGSLWGLHLGTSVFPTSVRESEGFLETGGLALAAYLLQEGVLQSAPVHNGFLSAVHTEEDVDAVIEAHRRSLRRMVTDGLLGEARDE